MPKIQKHDQPADDAHPILVTGMHRSGTTWVGRMLRASGVLVSVQEPLKPTNRRTIFRSQTAQWYTYITSENEGDYLQAFLDAVAFRAHPLDEIRRMRSPRDAVRVVSRWAGYGRGRIQGGRLLIKDPFAVFSADWFARRLACDVVIVVRHPAAVVSSLKRLGYVLDLRDLLDQPLLMKDRLEPFRSALETCAGSPRDVISQGSLLWSMIYDFASQYRAECSSISIVRHEDLSSNPQQEFARLYRRLQLPFGSSAQRTITRYTNERNPTEVSRTNPVARPLDSRANVRNWTRRLEPAEIMRIRELTSDVWPRFYTDDEWVLDVQQHA
jgi:hypothetical protein